MISIKMKWIILLSCSLFVDGIVNERFGKIDEDYGLSYVVGLNHYIYDPKIVSPYIQLNEDNSGMIVNADGVMIQGSSDKTHFYLQYDHCAPNTKDEFFTCICFELDEKGSQANYHNEYCDSRNAMAVCKSSKGRNYKIAYPGKTYASGDDISFDWNLDMNNLKVGDQTFTLKVEQHLPLNGKTTRKMDKSDGFKGFRIYSSYRGEASSYDGNAKDILEAKKRKCTSFTFKNGIFMGNLIGDQLETTDRIIPENGTTEFEPVLATVAELSCERYNKYCERFCEDQKIEVRTAPTDIPEHMADLDSGTNGKAMTGFFAIITIFGFSMEILRQNQ